MSPITLAPVVVKPLMVSKYASIGLAMSPPSIRYGMQPSSAAASHVTATTTKASRTPMSSARRPQARSTIRPTATPPTSGITKGRIDSS